MGMGKIKLKNQEYRFFCSWFFACCVSSAFQPKKGWGRSWKSCRKFCLFPPVGTTLRKKIVSITPAVGQPVFGVVYLSRRRRSGFYPCRGSVGDHDQEHDDGYDHQDFLDGTTFDPADEFCKHRIFLPDCVTLWLKLFTFVKNNNKIRIPMKENVIKLHDKNSRWWFRLQR